jgi:hypothetical protein
MCRSCLPARTALLAAVLALSGRAAAQTPAPLPVDSIVQHRVRLRVPDLQHGPLFGTVQGVEGGTLTVLRDDWAGAVSPTLDIPFTVIRQLEVSRGREPRSLRRPVVRGAMWGATIGVIFGAVWGFAQEQSGAAGADLSIAQGAATYGLVFGALGAGAGLVLAPRAAEVWQTVPLPPTPRR